MEKKNDKAAAPPRLSPRYDARREREENVIGRRIAEARRSRGWSLQELGERLESFGVRLSRAGISKWETGDTAPNAYQLMALCSALELEELTYFMSRRAPALNGEGLRKVAEYRADLAASGRYRPAPEAAEPLRFIEMPVSSLRVSAGGGAFLDEGGFETVSFPEGSVPAGADFGVRVSGDSMEPVYHDGQIVWVRQGSRVNPGEVGVFLCDGEGFLKVYSEQTPEDEAEYTDSYGAVHPQPVLLSYNRAYAPKVVSPHMAFQVVGRVL